MNDFPQTKGERTTGLLMTHLFMINQTLPVTYSQDFGFMAILSLGEKESVRFPPDPIARAVHVNCWIQHTVYYLFICSLQTRKEKLKAWYFPSPFFCWHQCCSIGVTPVWWSGGSGHVTQTCTMTVQSITKFSRSFFLLSSLQLFLFLWVLLCVNNSL